MKTIFQCSTPEEAADLDRRIFQTINGQGVGWSGVLTNGTHYGVLFHPTIGQLLALTDEQLAVRLIDSLNDEWYPHSLNTPPSNV